MKSIYKSTKTHSNKRQTVHVSSWVKPSIKAELESIANKENISVSATIAALVEEALRQRLHIRHAVLLEPIIEKAINKNLRAMSNRQASLLVRVAFDAGQTRALTTNILGKMPGVTTDMINEILDESSRSARNRIINKTPQLQDLIEEVKKIFEAKEKKTN